LLQKIIDIIYPARCPICEEIIIPKDIRVCSSCKSKLSYVEEPRCMKCSKPIEHEEKEYCIDCERKKYSYERGFSIWVYDDLMKKSIAAFKYNNKKEYAGFYIDEMLRLYGDAITKLKPDAIVPVPIHRSKYFSRGYNQAEILARGIGKALNVPVIANLLIRKKRTEPQKKLDNRQRLANLQKAIIYNYKAVKNNKTINSILLVDDIYTTGSTIAVCSNVLIANGVQKVYFITLCIGKGF